MPDDDELEGLVEDALLTETLMGWDTQPARRTCGCWNAINPPHNLDLRNDMLHGTPGHAGHGNTIHAWCAICSPGSVPVFEELRDRQ